MFLASNGGAFTKSDIDALNQGLAGGFGPGQVFYVDGVNGNDQNTGLSPTVLGPTVGPVKTIAQALAYCASGRGDTVYIFPGTYAENVVISGLNNLTLAAAVPVGNAKRPAIAPASGIALDVQNVKGFVARGLRFASADDVGVQTSGEGALWLSCDFTSTTTHGCQLYGRSSADFTSSGAIFRNCLFRECGGAGIHLKEGAGGAVGLYATNVIVDGCQFYLNTDDDINDDAPGGALAAFSQWDICNSHFMTVDKVTYLDLNGTTGGGQCQVSNNKFSVTVNTNYATQFQMPAVSTGGFVGNFSSIGVIDGHTF